jgi:hypothetical protein
LLDSSDSSHPGRSRRRQMRATSWIGRMGTLVVAAGIVAGFPAGASALIAANGEQLNGVSVNGVSLNGKSLNGHNLNGESLNGRSLNGENLNGQNLNGKSPNGSALQGRQTGASSAVTATKVVLPGGVVIELPVPAN